MADPDGTRTGPAETPAQALLRAHWTAADYTRCVESAPSLEPPAAVGDGAALWLLSALAVAESFGLLDAARADVVRACMAQALDGAADAALDAANAETVLAWCAAAGEWCEREGLDAPYARLAARAAAVDALAPGRARVHWRIAAAWHHESWGRFDAVGRLLAEAAALAADDAALAIVVGLKQARLALARSSPAEARARADAIAGSLKAGEAPLWWADVADIRARAALATGDHAAALHQARLCDGLARQARATPAYTAPYRVNECYALLGQGATEAAVQVARAVAAARMPARQQRRVSLLAQLAGLVHDDSAGRWDGDALRRLGEAMRELRDLEWTGVFAYLPAVVARLWARALEAGIETGWVRAAIVARRLAPPEPGWPEAWPWALRIRVLGGFDLQGPEATPVDGARPAIKPMDLLRRLAAESALEPMLLEPLAAALWPGEGRDGRLKALETTLARLRRLLGDAAVLRQAERRLRLDPQRVWLDRVALERRLGLIDAEMVGGAAAQRDVLAHHWHEALLLWRGPLLADAGPDDAVAPWLLDARQRLRQRLASCLLGSAALAGHEARCLRARAADPGLDAWLSPH